MIIDVFGAGDIFRHIDAGDGFCGSLIRIGDGKGEFLAFHLGRLNGIADEQEQDSRRQTDSKDQSCFRSIFCLHLHYLPGGRFQELFPAVVFQGLTPMEAVCQKRLGTIEDGSTASCVAGQGKTGGLFPLFSEALVVWD
jgi:hypothetical protein